MIRPRVIPTLLIRNKGLVKTRQFKDFKYVGDPLNAVRIFNEKLVDEIIIIDIDASSKNQKLDFHLIERIASECRMPMCYGGGIKSYDDARKIISLGVEKVALSSSIIKNPSLIREISDSLGSQSVVGVIDIKSNFLKNYHVYIHNGKIKCSERLEEILNSFIRNGVGEIVINCIDRDGMLNGYDQVIIEKLKKFITVPLTIIGGANSIEDMRVVWENHGLVGCAAGSLFVFKGKYSAILINYPSLEDKINMIKNLKF